MPLIPVTENFVVENLYSKEVTKGGSRTTEIILSLVGDNNKKINITIEKFQSFFYIHKHNWGVSNYKNNNYYYYPNEKTQLCSLNLDDSISDDGFVLLDKDKNVFNNMEFIRVPTLHTGYPNNEKLLVKINCFGDTDMENKKRILGRLVLKQNLKNEKPINNLKLDFVDFQFSENLRRECKIPNVYEKFVRFEFYESEISTLERFMMTTSLSQFDTVRLNMKCFDKFKKKKNLKETFTSEFKMSHTDFVNISAERGFSRSVQTKDIIESSASWLKKSYKQMKLMSKQNKYVFWIELDDAKLNQFPIPIIHQNYCSHFNLNKQEYINYVETELLGVKTIYLLDCVNNDLNIWSIDKKTNFHNKFTETVEEYINPSTNYNHIKKKDLVLSVMHFDNEMNMLYGLNDSLHSKLDGSSDGTAMFIPVAIIQNNKIYRCNYAENFPTFTRLYKKILNTSVTLTCEAKSIRKRTSESKFDSLFDGNFTAETYLKNITELNSEYDKEFLFSPVVYVLSRLFYYDSQNNFKIQKSKRLFDLLQSKFLICKLIDSLIFESLYLKTESFIDKDITKDKFTVMNWVFEDVDPMVDNVITCFDLGISGKLLNSMTMNVMFTDVADNTKKSNNSVFEYFVGVNNFSRADILHHSLTWSNKNNKTTVKIPDKNVTNPNKYNKRNVTLDDSTLKGGKTLDAELGLHRNCQILDVKSMYPSIIIEHNLSFDTEDRKTNVFENKYTGIIPLYLKKMIKCRNSFKMEISNNIGDLSDIPIHILKLIELKIKLRSNIVYGTLGTQNSRFSNVVLGNTITKHGRDIVDGLTEMVSSVKSKDFSSPKTVYGQTDSVMIESESVDASKKHSKEIIDLFNNSFNSIRLKMDAYYDFVLVINKQNYYGCKIKRPRNYLVGLEENIIPTTIKYAFSDEFETSWDYVGAPIIKRDVFDANKKIITLLVKMFFYFTVVKHNGNSFVNLLNDYVVNAVSPQNVFYNFINTVVQEQILDFKSLIESRRLNEVNNILKHSVPELKVDRNLMSFFAKNENNNNSESSELNDNDLLSSLCGKMLANFETIYKNHFSWMCDDPFDLNKMLTYYKIILNKRIKNILLDAK